MNPVILNVAPKQTGVKAEELHAWRQKAVSALHTLEEGSGPGADFTGWLRLPSTTLADEALLAQIQAIRDDWSRDIDTVVVIGIGGSYLGAKAVIDGLSHTFGLGHDTQILFAGHNIGEDYMHELLELLTVRSAACVVISKSGTTTEPAIAFRLIKNHIETVYGKDEARRRIVAITDAAKGALRGLATQEGYRSFVIPDNVGGRFSVLTPVGLLPIALAGFDIKALLQGAALMEEITLREDETNPALTYAALRQALYSQGKKVELLANFHPKLHYFTEWWKQLYGESEGKDHLGIFPAGVDFTTDLHSMGQYIQDGERHLFETVISVDQAERELHIPSDPQDLDGLNYLAGRRIDQCNKMAEAGTLLAHVDGGVPNIGLRIGKLDAYHLGALIYFFEKACGISGYIQGVNPFNQEGVEAYKKNMFALLGKPGYEKNAEALRARLSE